MVVGNMVADIFYYSCLLALVLLKVALVITLVRLRIGPDLVDRVLALELMFTLGIAIIGAVCALTGQLVYVDVAIALALVGFLGTAAFAFFVLKLREVSKGSRAARAK